MKTKSGLHKEMNLQRWQNAEGDRVPKLNQLEQQINDDR
jgi:hypothetical protein